MEERPPRYPRVAWAESVAPQERRPPVESDEVTEMQSLHADADCLPPGAKEENEEMEEKEALSIIENFLRRTEKEDKLKVMFLESICSIARISKNKGFCDSLAIFCRKKKLAEKVKELLENEPMDQLCTAVRYQAMLAVAALSEMKAISEDEIMPLAFMCFKAISYLPPEEDLNICLYNQTLHAMEKMLQKLLVSHRTSSRKELQNILQVLLPFTKSQRKTVRERAMEQIWKLCGFMATGFCEEPFGKLLQPPQRTDIVLMALERTTADCVDEDDAWAEIILKEVLRQPGIWLMHVPVIMGFIYRRLKSNKTSVQQTLLSVLDVLAYQFPRHVLTAVLIHLPQTDSTTMDMWKGVLSSTRSSERVLEALVCAVPPFPDCDLPDSALYSFSGLFFSSSLLFPVLPPRTGS
ncbi:uncharacterized protein LOC107306452 isoform X1 [Coturnix japonica]|uniref:uncharacterized protein LOC107306452 isoform X1 n=1 Tax=Coturnix japonica TaxID=93934 RepID=UPI0013A5C4D6|nr:uncharacterized protein LOC107306452 isoform X1 [Coturnix japonica]